MKQPYLGVSPQDSVRVHTLTGVAGTNTITANATPGLPSLLNGNLVSFKPANPNTGATTLNVDTIGAKNILRNNAALAGGELSTNVPVVCFYDGTSFHIVGGSGSVSGQVVSQNPTAATLPSTVIATIGVGSGSHIKIVGRYAYIVTSSTGAMTIYDIANPASPVLISTLVLDSNGQCRRIKVQGNYAYIVSFANASKLWVVDISNPFTPTVANGTGTVVDGTVMCSDVFIAGTYAYVTGYGNFLKKYDVSNPATPRLIGTTTFTGGYVAYSVFVQGDYAYIAFWSGFQGIRIVRTSTMADVGNLAIGGSPGLTDLWVVGKYAYTVGSNVHSMYVINVANPAAPSLTATSASIGSACYSLAVYGDFAYIGSNAYVSVFNVSVPASPTQVGSSIVTTGLVYGLALSGSYLFNNEGASGVRIRQMPTYDLATASIDVLETGTQTVQQDSYIGGNQSIAGSVGVGGNANIDGDLAVTGRFAVDESGNTNTNNSGSARATTATNGFFYIPTCAGAPTGTPALLPTGAAPAIIDSVSKQLFVYVGGTWVGVGARNQTVFVGKATTTLTGGVPVVVVA